MNTEEKILEILARVEQKLEEHSEILQSHSEFLQSHSEILQSHSEILQSHSEILQSHSEILQRHDEKLAALSHEVVKINLTLENDVERKFGAIFDKLDSIDARLDVLPTPEDQIIVNGRLDVLEATVKKLSRDVTELKKAQ